MNNDVIFPAVVIESDTTTARREAKAAHERWLADPESIPLRHSYGAALARWARLSGTQRASRYAALLLAPTPYADFLKARSEAGFAKGDAHEPD